MAYSVRALTVIIALVALTAPAIAQPVVTEINGDVFTRSQRVAILGSGFGAPGEVVIAGLSAWTTTWTDERVVAYIPEAAAVGPTTLHVVSARCHRDPESSFPGGPRRVPLRPGCQR